MSRETFFTIDVAGAPRVLFSVQQRGSGDLTIIVKHGTNSTPGATYNVPNDGYSIIQHRISVHSSPLSVDINALKLTTVLKNGTRILGRNFTKAIKGCHRFAPLYIERCRNLSDPRYIIKEMTAPTISLGQFDPRLFQLVYHIFVGATRTEFRTYCKSDDINLVQEVFGGFRIVVIWSYFGIPSDTTGDCSFYRTTRPEEILQLEEEGLKAGLTYLADGFDAEECIDIFRISRRKVLESFFQTVEADSPEDQRHLMPRFRSFVGLFSSPSLESREYADHRRRLELLPPESRVFPRTKAG